MKRVFILAGVLSALLLSTPSKAQFEIDVTSIQRLIELKNLVDKAQKQIGELQAGNTIASGTKGNTNGILKTGLQIENLLRMSNDFLQIAAKYNLYSDVSEFEGYSENSQFPIGQYINSAQFELGNFIAAVQSNKLTKSSGMDLYDFMHTGYTYESQQQVNDAGEYSQYKKDALNRVYGLQTAVQKRKMQQALTYYKMADELEKKALAINQAVTGNVKGNALQLDNSDLLPTASQANSQAFSDPFNFDNTYSSDAMSDLISLATSSAGGSSGILSALGSLLSTGIGGGEIKQQMQQMEAKAQADAMKQAMSMFGGGAGVDYSSYASVQHNPQQGFGTDVRSDGLRLTTGERINGQKNAYDLYVKASELREKADQLMIEATNRTPVQKYIDGIRERKFMREAMASIKF